MGLKKKEFLETSHTIVLEGLHMGGLPCLPFLTRSLSPVYTRPRLRSLRSS